MAPALAASGRAFCAAQSRESASPADPDADARRGRQVTPLCLKTTHVHLELQRSHSPPPMACTSARVAERPPGSTAPKSANAASPESSWAKSNPFSARLATQATACVSSGQGTTCHPPFRTRRGPHAWLLLWAVALALPAQVWAQCTVAQVTAGNFHTCTRLSSGSVNCFGYGTYGALGVCTHASPREPPHMPASPPCAGDFRTCCFCVRRVCVHRQCWRHQHARRCGRRECGWLRLADRGWRPAHVRGHDERRRAALLRLQHLLPARLQRIQQYRRRRDAGVSWRRGHRRHRDGRRSRRFAHLRHSLHPERPLLWIGCIWTARFVVPWLRYSRWRLANVRHRMRLPCAQGTHLRRPSATMRRRDLREMCLWAAPSCKCVLAARIIAW